MSVCVHLCAFVYVYVSVELPCINTADIPNLNRNEDHYIKIPEVTSFILVCLSLYAVSRSLVSYVMCTVVRWKVFMSKVAVDPTEYWSWILTCSDCASQSVNTSMQKSLLCSVHNRYSCFCVRNQRRRGKDPILSMPALSHNPTNPTSWVCAWWQWFKNIHSVGLLTCSERVFSKANRHYRSVINMHNMASSHPHLPTNAHIQMHPDTHTHTCT